MMGPLRELVWRLGLLLALVGDAHQQKSIDDFTWVKNFAAVGDSYTAGVGAGSPISGDDPCYRFDGSYASMLARQFTSLQNFYNLGCTGARSPDILTQIQQLPGNLDLAVMTAGGNDLCLTQVLKSCIFSHAASVEGCNKAMLMAKNGLDTYFSENIQSLIEALDTKMGPKGIIIVAGYAEFFDATTDACTNEHWSLLDAPSLPLSKPLRAALNNLVVMANDGLLNAVDNAKRNIKSDVALSNWNDWPNAVEGLFCGPGQDPNPFNPPILCQQSLCRTSNLQFFKLNTRPAPLVPGISIRSNPELTMADVPHEEWDRLINYTASLSRRAITPPVCPSSSGSVPVKILKLFHPTILGHTTILTFVLEAIRTILAGRLGVPTAACTFTAPFCTKPSSFTDPSAYAPYVSLDAVHQQLLSFCSAVDQTISNGGGSTPFSFGSSYYQGLPDSMQLSVKFDSSSSPKGQWSNDDCVSAFNTLLTQCWTDDNPSLNPLQWAYGGSYSLKAWNYTVQPINRNRLWPPPTSPQAFITGHLNIANGISSWGIMGAGWADFDWGQKTLLANITSCLQENLLQWGFKYFPSIVNGFEWEAFVQTKDSKNLNCLTTGAAIRAAGGPDTVSIHYGQTLSALETVCADPVVDQSKLTCAANCCGFIPCPAWCNAFCGGKVCG